MIFLSKIEKKQVDIDTYVLSVIHKGTAKAAPGAR